ncbi:unnamed protein product [Rhizophagus irregularis]|nr:unnamed protein product [Rhizophagus irregularis]
MTINQFSSIHTSLTFNPFEPILCNNFDNQINSIFLISQKKLTDWSLKYSEKLPQNFLNLKDKIMGCSFNPSSDSMIVWGANYLCLIDFNKCKIKEGTDNNDELICARCSGQQSKPKFLKKQQSGEQEQKYEKIYTDTIQFSIS